MWTGEILGVMNLSTIFLLSRAHTRTPTNGHRLQALASCMVRYMRRADSSVHPSLPLYISALYIPSQVSRNGQHKVVVTRPRVRA